MLLVELSDKKMFTATADLSGCSAAPYQETANVRRHQHLRTRFLSSERTNTLPVFKRLPCGPSVQRLKLYVNFILPLCFELSKSKGH